LTKPISKKPARKKPATQQPASLPAPTAAADLLNWAQQHLKIREIPTNAPLSDADTRRLLYQLQVQHIELEMQNEELRESRAQTEALLARYTDLFDFAPAGLFTIEKNGTLNEVNLTGASLLGVERAKLIGQRFATYVTKADRPVFGTLLTQVFASRNSQTCELALESPGHSLIDITLEASLSPDAMQCSLVLLDITARKQAQRVLAESEARTSAIIESAMDAIITVDEGTNIVVFNQAAVAMFGCPAVEAIGRPVGRFIPQRFQVQHKAQIRAFGDSGITSRSMGQPGHVTALRATGEEFPVEAAISHAATFGHQFYTVILRDITQSQLARETLERSQRDLRALSKAGNNALEAERTRIAREMHDEFGQALTAMKMDLESLRKNLPPDQPQQHARALAMRNLLDGLVVASRRIASDLRPLVLDDLGLGAALEWLTQNFSQRTGIVVKLTVDDALAQVPEPLASALFRITQESLTNINQHAQARMVVVRLEQEDAWLQLTVRDNGRGIEVSDMGKRGSYGLLGIRERVTLLGGELVVSRNPTQGTQLRVRIPLAAPANGSTY
jgi:PAS domain S-box-containing protein